MQLALARLNGNCILRSASCFFVRPGLRDEHQLWWRESERLISVPGSLLGCDPVCFTNACLRSFFLSLRELLMPLLADLIPNSHPEEALLFAIYKVTRNWYWYTDRSSSLEQSSVSHLCVRVGMVTALLPRVVCKLS